MLADIRQLLNDSPAHRRAPAVDAWILEAGHLWRSPLSNHEVEAAKVAVIERAWALPTPLWLVPPDDSLDAALQMFVGREHDGWRVDTSTSPQDFYRLEPVSVLGNWQLYTAPLPLRSPLPDSFRVEPGTLLAFMRAHRVSLLIDAFHDNTDWSVALDIDNAL